jgi:pyruvate/2-oxoglutarate dehydrogenase complex dihydrolipoamide acyltransferase (E2) component
MTPCASASRNAWCRRKRRQLLTTFNEIDMTEVVALRKEHQEAFQKRYGTKVGESHVVLH